MKPTPDSKSLVYIGEVPVLCVIVVRPYAQTAMQKGGTGMAPKPRVDTNAYSVAFVSAGFVRSQSRYAGRENGCLTALI